MRRAISLLAAGVVLATGLAAPAFAASGEDAYARAVASCLGRQTGAFEEVFTAEELSKPAADDTEAARIEREHGPVLRVASDNGVVYLVKEPDRCEAWGSDLDASAAMKAVGAIVEAAPYAGKVPAFLKKVQANEDPIMRVWIVKTGKGGYKVVGGNATSPPRAVFTTITRE